MDTSMYIYMYVYMDIMLFTCPGQDVPRSLAILGAVCRFTLLRDFVAARRLVLAHDLVVGQLQRPLGLYQVRSCRRERECVHMCLCVSVCVFVCACIVQCVFAQRSCGCIVKFVRMGVSALVRQLARVFSCFSCSSITSQCCKYDYKYVVQVMDTYLNRKM